MEKVIGFLIAAFLWYLAGYFISSESNLMLWPWYGKIFFIIILINMAKNIADE